MTRVLWQTTSTDTYNAWIRRATRPAATGGSLYELDVLRILDRHTELQLDAHCVSAGSSRILSFARRWRTPPPCDLMIKDQRMIALGRRGLAPVTLGIVHHLELALAERHLRYRAYFRALRRRLPGLTAVVTVSRYWQDMVRSLGCRDVEIIYNSFDPAEYVTSPARIAAFFSKFGLPPDRPLIYLGGAGAQKGAAEAWRALKEEDYTFLVTGRNPANDPPVRTLILDRADYVAMLHAASVVVTLSTLPEGWCRVAHEAMLCRTPVIGSGIAGMRELLEGGGQVICPTPDGLREAVRGALAQRMQFGASGYEFVRRFDMTYLEEAWLRLVDRLMGSSGKQQSDVRHMS